MKRTRNTGTDEVTPLDDSDLESDELDNMPFDVSDGSPITNAWPATEIVMRSIESLTPYENNARVHSEEQIAQIAESMQEWGWTNPVLIDEQDGIIAGHGRVSAARQLGIEQAPCIVAQGWTEAQKRAYVIADNKLTDNGGFDNALLGFELAALSEEGFDLSLTGFSDAEVEALNPDFEPGTEEEQGRLDQLEPKIVACPHCGEEFDLREQG